MTNIKDPQNQHCTYQSNLNYFKKTIQAQLFAHSHLILVHAPS